jgi:Carboxypeptidase regulatory-like domain
VRTNFGRHFANYCCLMVLATLSLLTTASAQQTLGSINGTVLDASSAAVSGSTVTVTDADINITRTVQTQANGFFQIFNLPIGTYKVHATHDGFDTTELVGVSVQEARATTLNITLKVGQISTSVEVTSNPLLNATDATNGYTLDAQQIAITPLATGSFTQLAVLSPGVNAELLSGLDSNSGLGNQPIWANGQRSSSNTFQVNGVDATNLFNGQSSSGSTSQRYNFNIGGGSTSGSSSAGAATVGGANPVGTSVFGSNGNSLPSPPPEFLQELRVNTSMYDAQQGATSGAQIDANTLTGTNKWHGQLYGTFANSSLNAAPYFFKQEYLLATQGIGSFPESLANPSLHRWNSGLTVGGPVIKNKLFFFAAYQHGYNSDQSTALSQFNVPSGLSDDRSTIGLTNALTSWNNGTPLSGVTISPIASALMNAKLPSGQYMIPSAQNSQPFEYGVPNVTLIGTSALTADQATASLDYDLTKSDRLEFKYYYQNDPVTKPYNFAQVGGFPSTQDNGSQVGALDNTITIGSRLNWEQRLGYARMLSYSYYTQTLPGDPSLGSNYGIGSGSTPPSLGLAAGLPGLLLEQFPIKGSSSVSPSLKVGPFSSFADMGYYQNRLNPSTNVILTVGNHTLVAGGGYNYTQLNIDNNRTGIAQITAQNFETFLEGNAYKSNVVETIDPNTHKNLADRYYRSNEFSGYLQDKWQARSNLSITAGVRYDYHGGLTEKYGNLFNFDPSLYNVTGTPESGFDVLNAGFVVAPNNGYKSSIASSNLAGSDSTLTGRQWGISPRIGFAWSPKKDEGKVVIRGGAGIYYDRGELFTYLSQPAGSGTGGPFGVTESSPLATYVSSSKTTFSNPLGAALTSSSYVPPSSNPSVINNALAAQLAAMTATSSIGKGSSEYTYGNCTGVGAEEDATCPSPLNFGAYDKNNVLPYTINFTLNMQWQPTNDLAITVGYTGNRGRHSIVPIPFNEAQIATPSNPAMILGASPHSSGETATYGFEVLNQNNLVGPYDDYAPIGSEPWSTYTGGNTDWRVPYVGFNSNAVLFKTVGNSAYDALETHLEKRLSNHVQGGASYTWSHSLDEQSGVGLFFTGNNPNNLRNSWASSDFDRTNVFSANFQVQIPNAAQAHTLLSYVTNDWNLTGIGIVQSGEPYSLYEFYGAVGSAYVGNYPNLLNPVLSIKDPNNPKSAFTGNRGSFRAAGGNYIPAIDPSQVAVNYLSPGEKGVPTAAQGNPGDPLDTYETDFAPGNQRNIFRQPMQKRLDISVRKDFRLSDKFTMQYQFNVFNLTNTTSLDVPQNQTGIRQTTFACSNSALEMPDNDCSNGYTYGQVVTNPADQATNNGRGTAGQNLDKLPYANGTGKATTVPLTLLPGQGTCTSSTLSTGGCPNNGANFGSITGTIGGARAVTMGLRITY